MGREAKSLLRAFLVFKEPSSETRTCVRYRLSGTCPAVILSNWITLAYDFCRSSNQMVTLALLYNGTGRGFLHPTRFPIQTSFPFLTKQAQM
jgi:hypothetical protein